MDWFLRCNLHFCSLDFDLIILLWAQKVTGMFVGGGGGTAIHGLCSNIAVGKSMVFKQFTLG